MNYIKFTFYLILSIASCVSAGYAEIKVEVLPSASSTYVGDSIQVSVKVSSFAESAVPDMTQIKGMSFNLIKRESQNYSYTENINGVIKRRSFRGQVFIYTATPTATGNIRLGPVSVTSGSDKGTSDGPIISVKGVEKQDYVKIEIIPSRTKVLPDETFQIKLRFRIKALPPPHNNIDPLSPTDPPSISADFLYLNEVKGLICPPVKDILNSLVAKSRMGPSFYINGYLAGSGFHQSYARFMTEAESVEISGTNYLEYSIDLNYTAELLGTYTFGPATFKGLIIKNVDQARHGVTTNIYAVAPMVTVTVEPPPETGRPAYFNGAIGSNMVADAELDVSTCNAGDPIKLTLTLSGDVNLKNATAPDLENRKEISDLFRVYHESAKTVAEENSKSFTYILRPLTAGTMEVPPFQFSFYDTDTRTYKTIETRAIPLRVNAVNIVDESALISDYTGGVDRVSLSGQDLPPVAPLIFSANPPVTPLHSGKRGILPLISGVLLFLAALAIKLTLLLITRFSPSARRKELRRSALRSISKLRGSEANELYRACALFFSAVMPELPESVTPDQISAALRSRGADKETCRELESMLQNIFNSGYNSSSDSPVLEPKKVTELLLKAEADIKKRNRGRSAESITLSIILFITLTSSLYAGNRAESTFTWREASSLSASAGTPEEFRTAASVYLQFSDSSDQSGEALYNAGTCFLMAGDREEALFYLTRAEKYLGSTWSVKRNMRLASLNENDELNINWARIPLFFHYLISCSLRESVAAIAFLILCICFALRLFIRSRFIDRLIILTALTAAVLALSASITSLSESHSLRFQPAYDENPAVTAEEVPE